MVCSGFFEIATRRAKVLKDYDKVLIMVLDGQAGKAASPQDKSVHTGLQCTGDKCF